MKRLKSILVHVDTRRDESDLLARVSELAKFHGATVTIVDVVPDFSWPVRVAATDYNEVRRAMIQQKEGAINTIATSLRNDGVTVQAKVLCGVTSDEIIREVVRSQHDLVIKDAKGQFSSHPGTFGKTATRLIRYCPCPVWAFRPSRSGTNGQVLVAVDATAEDSAHIALNTNILNWATAISGNQPPHVVHVWSVYGENLVKDYMKRDEFESLVKEAEHEAREQMRKLVEPLKLSVDDPHVHLRRGNAAHELIHFVQEGKFDALVLGTVARTGVSGMIMGNTAEALLNRVECSVIAIKPDDFKTPIHIS